MEKNQFPYNISFIKFQLIGTAGTRLLREKRGHGDPAGERRGRTARGKRVPGVEIISHTTFRKSAPFPPTVCQASSAQATAGSRLASYSAGVSQISSINEAYSKKTSMII
ncbi:hypothetical protein [Peribacillus frigoritolerans]|uniref:hypothetical protein n=1 Tax=Peribacillus castrilensis TaxID=2897690 RepID=UPI002DC5C997|nr:hypothetical protein [Peribacillus castrilensis]